MNLFDAIRTSPFVTLVGPRPAAAFWIDDTNQLLNVSLLDAQGELSGRHLLARDQVVALNNHNHANVQFTVPGAEHTLEMTVYFYLPQLEQITQEQAQLYAELVRQVKASRRKLARVATQRPQRQSPAPVEDVVLEPVRSGDCVEGVWLEHEATVYLQIDAVARKIERDYADYLPAAPEGIYMPSQLEPVMRSHMPPDHYYRLVKQADGSFQRVGVEDISDLSCAIYETGKGNVPIIPKAYMENRARHLRMVPFLPYQGYKVVEVLVRDHLDSFVAYPVKKRPLEDQLLQHLNLPSANDQAAIDWALQQTGAATIEDALERLGVSLHECRHAALRDDVQHLLRLFEPLAHALDEFVGAHDKRLYLVRWEGPRLAVVKSMDYRAYEWERQRLQSEGD